MRWDKGLRHCLRPVLLLILTICFCTSVSPAFGLTGEEAAPSPTDSPQASAQVADRTATLWGPFEEWSISNSSYSGNPFDVVAEVRFEHQGSNAVHSTGMFYDGADTWKFRFTGTRTGTWTFTTSSNDPELDGLSGTVHVEPNPDEEAYGFMTSADNKWARYQGNDRAVEAFVPQLVMYRDRPAGFGDEAMIADDISTFIADHGFNGFHIPSLGGLWFDANGSREVGSSMSNPDPATFEALERLITRTHAAGGVVHIWAWGDQQRGWTPTELSGGVNGPEDRRLQRYIAARLGPLPGWSIGYGFDLNEWAPATTVGEWRNYVQEHMGWHHFVGGRPEGPNSGTNHAHYVEWNEALDYSSYEHHQPSYEVYTAALEAVPGQPVMSEDRFRIREGGYPDKDYTMELVRRGLWRSTMAGGVANIWGHLHNSPAEGGSGPFPEPEWIATYNRFFEKDNRFSADMQRANSLTSNEAARVLKSSDNSLYVIYQENTASLQADLSNMSGAQSAVAVDTRRTYDEISLGTVDPGSFAWNAPRSSDWAIVVGTGSNSMNDQTISLAEGWNIASLSVEPSDNSMEQVFQDISSTVEVVENDAGEIYRPGAGVNEIGSWTPGEAYRIFATSATELHVSGTRLDPAQVSISLDEGWNWIPYLPAYSLPVGDALTNISSYVVLVKDEEGRVYHPQFGIDRLGTLEPGRGYKVYVNQSTTLTYP